MHAEAILGRKGREVVTLTSDATLAAAARVLDEQKIGAAVVTSADGAILGVLSERDIVREISRSGPDALGRPVAGSMTSEVVTAAPCDSVDRMMTQMTGRRIRHLPIVENGALVGIVSIGDVVKAKIENVQAEAEALASYISTGT